MAATFYANRKCLHSKTTMIKAIHFLFFLFPLVAAAQPHFFEGQKTAIGTTADSIQFTHYLQNAPAVKNYNKRFKVLEFWATWCKPCLKAVPHLNKMQAAFKGQNIVFLSVTYETPEKAAATLKKLSFETIVVSDTAKTIHHKLKIESNGTMALPRTVLIDDENKIVWYGSPNDLNAKLIKKFLAKEPI